ASTLYSPQPGAATWKTRKRLEIPESCGTRAEILPALNLRLRPDSSACACTRHRPARYATGRAARTLRRRPVGPSVRPWLPATQSTREVPYLSHDAPQPRHPEANIP